MGLYKYLRQAWKKPSAELVELNRQKMIQWRKQPTTVRIDHPSRLDRAHSIGFKAKQGIFLVRQRLSRGGRMRDTDGRGGRKSKNARRFLILDKSYQSVAEVRASSKYPNCEVLNSYFVAQDGKNIWFEIIMIERSHPNIVNDSTLRNVAAQRGRANRGLTSAGKKSRGLRQKGKGTEHMRR